MAVQVVFGGTVHDGQRASHDGPSSAAADRTVLPGWTTLMAKASKRTGKSSVFRLTGVQSPGRRAWSSNSCPEVRRPVRRQTAGDRVSPNVARNQARQDCRNVRFEDKWRWSEMDQLDFDASWCEPEVDVFDFPRLFNSRPPGIMGVRRVQASALRDRPQPTAACHETPATAARIADEPVFGISASQFMISYGPVTATDIAARTRGTIWKRTASAH